MIWHFEVNLRCLSVKVQVKFESITPSLWFTKIRLLSVIIGKILPPVYCASETNDRQSAFYSGLRLWPLNKEKFLLSYTQQEKEMIIIGDVSDTEILSQIKFW